MGNGTQAGTRTILLVEDDRRLLGNSRRLLEIRGYRVLPAASLREAREVLSALWPDLVILDIMLPDGNGLDLCREIRASASTPILLLTALGGNQDIVFGLNAGADDYLVKPFDFEVLLARIEALLRRAAAVQRPPEKRAGLAAGNLRLDLVSRRAYVLDEDILLTPTEFALLEQLVQQRGRYIPADRFYRAIWALAPDDKDILPVKQRVYALRRKLAMHEACGVVIETRRRMGYRIVETA